MATAEELLRSASLQPDPEGHIVVGGDRRITIPDNLKRLGVQFDHNMETVTFDCPRYWDDRDMSKMAIYINYMRSDLYRDRYLADKVAVDGDVMHFEWTISRNVTEVAGSISFLVCVVKTDADGNEERHWNSELCQDAYISPGMEAEESVVDLYPDIITQLLLRMDTVEQINVTADEMQTMREDVEKTAALAEEVKNQALDASGHIRNSYANAIKSSASGEIIQVNDVSPVEHDVLCRVHGKNLFDVSKIMTTSASVPNAYVSEVGSDYVIISTLEGYTGNGYCTVPVKVRDACPGLIVGRTYVLNANTESDSSNIYLPGIQRSWVFGTSMVMTEAILDSTMTLYGFSMGSGLGPGECRISNIQIELGTVATDYEPYIDPATATVTGCGKNLAYRNAVNITGTAGGSGSIGALSDTVIVKDIPIKRNTSYIVSMVKSDKVTTPRVFLYNGALNALTHTSAYNELVNNSRGVEKVALSGAIVNTDGYEYMAITTGGASTYTNGDVVNISISNLQLEIGNARTVFEPYYGDTATPASDGTCIVTSKSPTMTLFTDTPGVIIEAEYNVDTMKFLNAVITDERIKDAVTAWLDAYYTEAEGVSF